MATKIKGRFVDGLVNSKAGQVSREIFVNDEIYAQEQEQVFTRSWLYIGHESQVSKPGDYFVSSMGEESVILCRDRDSKLHVFLNSCMHRGMKVCRYDEGNTPVFTCPYHGWSYAADGKLVGVPFFKDSYREQLDKSKWGLVEVAQLATYRGSVWATWEPTAPPFIEYLGNFKMFYDLSLEAWNGTDEPLEVLGGVQKWIIPCNWKFPAENFSGDSYHNISHRSVDMVGIGPSGTGRRDMAERTHSRRLQVAFPERGHQSGVYVLPGNAPTAPSYQQSPEVAEYFREAEEKRRESKGEWGRVTGSPGLIFPNAALHPRQPRSIAVLHPRGAHQTEMWRWYFVDAGAPYEVKNFLRQYYIRYSGPGGLTEQDDMENWNYAHAASRGAIARRHPYSYEQGLGFEQTNYEYEGLKFPGQVMDLGDARSSEQNLRNFYKRWAEFMDAPSWDELASWR